MRIAMFSTKPYDRRSFDAANEGSQHEVIYLEPRLAPLTRVRADRPAKWSTHSPVTDARAAR